MYTRASSKEGTRKPLPPTPPLQYNTSQKQQIKISTGSTKNDMAPDVNKYSAIQGNRCPQLPLPINTPIDGTMGRRTSISRNPELPPKQEAFQTQTNAIKPMTQTYLEGYYVLPEELSVFELVQMYQGLFPIRVFVCKGFYGANERLSLSEGDVYNMHFVKKTKAIIVQDCSLHDYKVALNSSVQFGLLHNPEGNLQKAKDGYKYAKVRDIMAVSPLPKVVRVTAAFKGTSPDNSIEPNELLVIKEVRPYGNRRILVVYSLTTSRIKNLFEACEGHFSTKPFHVRLFLPEILAHVPQPFPSSCYLFPTSETTQELPNHLFTSVATLFAESVEISIIASSTVETEYEGRQLLVEIPVDLDIEVQVMLPKDNTDTDSLSKATHELLENFDTCKVVHCVREPDSGDVNALAMPKQLEEEGIELVKSPAIKQWIDERTKERVNMPPQSQHLLSQTQDLTSSDEALDCLYSTLYEHTIDSKASAPITPVHVQTPPDAIDQDEHSRGLVSIRADIKRLDDKLTSDFAYLKEQMTRLTEILNSYLQRVVTDNQSELQLYLSNESMYSAYKSAVSAKSTFIDFSERESNIQFLRTLNTINVSCACMKNV